MDVVIVIGIAGLWVLAVALWFQQRTRDAHRSGDDTVTQASGTDLEVRDTDGAVELWWPGGGRLATIRGVERAAAGTPLRSPWARQALLSVLKRAGKAVPGVGAGRRARYRVTFPPDLMGTLASGGSVDVVLGGRALSTVGRGAIVGGPTVALAAGAVAVSVAQQQRLDRALVVIERRIDLVIDRMRDDDHGALDAAEALLDQLDRRSAEVPSPQLRAELATARHSVDAIYFARRRFGQRLGDAIGDAQAAATPDSGEAQAWAAGVLEAVGDPSQLRSELLVYLRAVVMRARLATSTSGILAIDGDIADANRLLAETVDDLREDFYGLYRRIRPLAQWAPKRALPWRRREWDHAHRTVVEIYELMSGEVEPLLPDKRPGPVELEAVVDEDGRIGDVTILD